MAFVVDTSSSDPVQFSSIQTVIKNIVSGFSFNETGPRAALVSFSGDAVLQLPFELYENPSSLKSAIDLMSMQNKQRRISNGLQITLKYLMSQSASEKKRGSPIVYLVTTGQQVNLPGLVPPTFVAESFHELGIKILALGVGNDVRKDELVKITKDSNLVRIVKDPKELAEKEKWRNMTMDICYASG